MTTKTQKWQLGEAVERPFVRNEETEEWFKRLEEYLPDVACKYVEEGLKSLGPEYTTQIPYGREMVDKAKHWMNFMNENFLPSKNNLKSVKDAGYAFTVLPEIEIFFDNHDLVNAPVITFHMLFVGEKERIPVEERWQKTLKCSMLGAKFQKMNHHLYTTKGCTSRHLSRLLYDDGCERYADIKEHYGFPRVLPNNPSYNVCKVDIYETTQNSPVLSSTFSESFLWSADFEKMGLGHPVIDPNHVANVPSTCRVDHRIGDPELLKWKEKGCKEYFKDVMKECSLEFKDENASSKVFGRSEGNISGLSNLTRTSDINNVFVSSSENGGQRKCVVSDFEEKKMSIESTLKPKQTTLDSFLRKTPEQVKQKKETKEEKDRLVNDDVEMAFLKKNRSYFSREFGNRRGQWLPDVTQLSHLVSPTSEEFLLNYDKFLQKLGSDITTVLKSWDGVNVDHLEENIVVYRCFMNTNVSHYHYRSFTKHIPDPPKNVVNKDILARELVKKRLVSPYSETALFHKLPLKEKMDESFSRLTALDGLYMEIRKINGDLAKDCEIALKIEFEKQKDLNPCEGDNIKDRIEESLARSKSLERLCERIRELNYARVVDCDGALDIEVDQQREFRLYDHLNIEKYKRLKWQMYEPNFVAPTLAVKKNEMEEALEKLIKNQNNKTKDMINALFTVKKVPTTEDDRKVNQSNKRELN